MGMDIWVDSLQASELKRCRGILVSLKYPKELKNQVKTNKNYVKKLSGYQQRRQNLSCSLLESE